MSVLAIWSRVVLSRVVSPHNFDGLAMSFLAFSASPSLVLRTFHRRGQEFVLEGALMGVKIRGRKPREGRILGDQLGV